MGLSTRFLGVRHSLLKGELLKMVKGVVLIKDEKGEEKVYTKYIYERMKKAGRKITLLKEGLHRDDLL